MNPRLSSRAFALFAVNFAVLLGAPLRAGGGLHLVGVEEQHRATPAAPLIAGQPATLEILIPPGVAADTLRPHARQFAGAIGAPISLDAEILPSAAIEDTRLIRVRLTPPAVQRVTSLALWLGEFGPVGLTVFPATQPRADLPSLAEALQASRLRLAVCGQGTELRDFLRAHSLDFEDFGTDAPDRLTDDTLLLGALRREDWDRLSGPRAGGHLIGFFPEPALVPGVYTRTDPAARRQLTKVTLPLLSLLPTDPRARETFHQILLQALSPAPSPSR